MQQQNNQQNNVNQQGQNAADQQKAATAASPKAATAWAAAGSAEAATGKIGRDNATSELEDVCHPLTNKQYRSLYWPLQMGQPIKSPNFNQQQCKCNKRQLGEETKPSPSIQMH